MTERLLGLLLLPMLRQRERERGRERERESSEARGIVIHNSFPVCWVIYSLVVSVGSF